MLFSIVFPLMFFLILMSLTYLNEDDKRSGAFQRSGGFYQATSLKEVAARRSILHFQLYVFAAHVLAFGYVSLSIPLELLFFIGTLWLPFFVAHTVLFRAYFLRWADLPTEQTEQQKHKRHVTGAMLNRLSTKDQMLEQRRQEALNTYYHEFHNQIFR